MEGKIMMHFSHDHPLILKAEKRKIDDDTNQSVEIKECDGCSSPISGPFYSCRECVYLLHKVCAELPSEMNHPMHPQHPLTLLSNPPSYYETYGGVFICNVCNLTFFRFTYHCSICFFDVDPICASASLAIEDECHQHPLTPVQLPLSFPCHICKIKEEGISYKCNICPFWVHQNCTVSLQNTVKHSDHHHPLTLLKYVPIEYHKFIRRCDICHDMLCAFHCVYCCEMCIFFAHVSCVRLDEEASQSRDQNVDSQCVALLPVQQKLPLTDLVSWFAENYSDQDAITNLILGFDESFIDRFTNMKKEFNFLNQKYPLLAVYQKLDDVVCDSCTLPISSPSYRSIDFGFIFHKYCTELPKKILHPAHPQHQISLHFPDYILQCNCCYQFSNGYGYACPECKNFVIDIKCASLLRPVKHRAHKHSLIPKFLSSITCIACNGDQDFVLQCNTCRFILCFRCAMSPSMMKHRYDKHPFKLTFSPPENHYKEYICELCEEDLNPKLWHYHCGICDQFAHLYCMLWRGADSNINYGRWYKIKGHKHDVTSVSCTYDTSLCNKCGFALRTGYSVGLKCIPCRFNIHLLCAENIRTYLPN